MKKTKIFSLLFVSSFALLLTSCDTDMIEEKISKTVNNMLPNLWVTLIQLAMFLLIVLAFIFFAYKPLKKKLKQRADYIENNIKSSEDTKKQAQDKLNEANQVILQSQKKAVDIVSSAQKTAEIKSNNVEKELAKQIENQKVLAHKDIEAEREKTLKEAHEEIVTTAILASKEILKREITEKDNDEFVNSFVNELTKSGK